MILACIFLPTEQREKVSGIEGYTRENRDVFGHFVCSLCLNEFLDSPARYIIHKCTRMWTIAGPAFWLQICCLVSDGGRDSDCDWVIGWNVPEAIYPCHRHCGEGSALSPALDSAAENSIRTYTTPSLIMTHMFRASCARTSISIALRGFVLIYESSLVDK